MIDPLKYLSTFWKTLEMPLINFEINLIIICSSTSVITNSEAPGWKICKNRYKTFGSNITLSTEDNAKLLYATIKTWF